MKGILLTSSTDISVSFAEEIKYPGARIFYCPMLDIRPANVPAPKITDYQALIFTSANGVKMFRNRHPGIGEGYTVYATGPQTLDAAKEEGFKNVICYYGKLENLEKELENCTPGMRLLYVHGQDIAFPLSRILKEKGTETDDYIIYRAVPCPEMPQYIREAIKNKSITDVLFFSARAGENFVSISRRSGLEKYICEINALCISVRVLKSVGALQWAGRYVADSPDRKGMISLLNTAT